MKHVMAVIFGLVVIIANSSISTAADDIKGSKDHSFITRMPGFFISGYNNVEFGSSKFIGPNKKAKQMEGKKTFIEYRLINDATVPGELKIRRTLQEDIKKMGGYVLFDDNFNRCSTLFIQKDGMGTWVDLRAYDKMYRLTIVEKEFTGHAGKITLIKGKAVTVEDNNGGKIVIEATSVAGLKVGDFAWCEEDCGKTMKTWDTVIIVRKILEQKAWGDPHVHEKAAQ